MKLGKLLTVTALATGVTIGGFVDSANALRRRTDPNSNIASFEFTIDDFINYESSSDSSGVYPNAVSDISFKLQPNFLQEDDDKIIQDFPSDGFYIIDEFSDTEANLHVSFTRRELVEVDEEVNILSLDIPLFIPQNTIRFPTSRFTEADNNTNKIPDNTRIEFDELEDKYFAIFTDSTTIDIRLRYQFGRFTEVDITSLSNILEELDISDTSPRMRDRDLSIDVRERFLGSQLLSRTFGGSTSSFIRYGSNNDNFKDFLRDIIGYDLDRLEDTNPGRENFVFDNIGERDVQFESLSEPTTVPENNSIFGLVSFSAVGVFFLRKKTVSNNLH